MLRLTVLIAVVVFSFPAPAADPVPVQGTIRSVDPAVRTVTVLPAGVNAKAVTYDLGRKTEVILDGRSATAAELKPGQTVTVVVDPKTEVISSIQVKSKVPVAEPGVLTVVVSGTGKDESAARKQAFAA